MELGTFSAAELVALRTMLRRNLNAPRTSSTGRLFDAVASLAGIRQKSSFEGQAAMELEFAASDCETDEHYPFRTVGDLLDWEPMIRGIVTDRQGGIAAGMISAKFHRTMAEMIVSIAKEAAEPCVALSGGCFQNELLLRLAVGQLREVGIKPVWQQRIPPNDGGIALGQVAAVLRKF